MNARFTIVSTNDGGRNWKKSPSENMPPVLKGEGLSRPAAPAWLFKAIVAFGLGPVGQAYRGCSGRITGVSPGKPTKRRSGPEMRRREFSRWRFILRTEGSPLVGITKIRSRPMVSSPGHRMEAETGHCQEPRGPLAIVRLLPSCRK